MSGADEFGEIARLFRPLTGGAAGAFDLLDDAAIVPQRPGFDLVITKDAIVEGVHFPVGEAPGLVAKKLLRVNLSDLAAKAAEPFGCFLAVAWPKTFGPADREAFARGLGEDLKSYGVDLLGGDTVSTPGPFTLSLTALGWVPAGRMVRRGRAKPLVPHFPKLFLPGREMPVGAYFPEPFGFHPEKAGMKAGQPGEAPFGLHAARPMTPRRKARDVEIFESEQPLATLHLAGEELR